MLHIGRHEEHHCSSTKHLTLVLSKRRTSEFYPQYGRRKAISGAWIQAGTFQNLELVLEFRNLFLNHLNPRRMFHDIRTSVEQRRTGCNFARLAPYFVTYSDHRLLYVRACICLSDFWRNLLVGFEIGRRQGWFLYRMA